MSDAVSLRSQVAAPSAQPANPPERSHTPTPAQRKNRYYVPDRALIDTNMPVRSDAEKARYNLVADLIGSRLYVVDNETNEPVDAYKISPGAPGHQTPAKQWKISRVMPMSWWNPPNSDWAKGKSATPPGLNSPMGVLKLYMGQGAYYIHGTAVSAYKDLGRPASKGCLRMSNGNVIDLYQNYATQGTVLTTSNNRLQSAALASKYAAAGLVVRDIHHGEEHVQTLINAYNGK